MTDLQEIVSTAVRRFATMILHGDDQHRAWLLDAAERFCRGELPLPKTPADTSALAQQEAGSERAEQGEVAGSSPAGGPLSAGDYSTARDLAEQWILRAAEEPDSRTPTLWAGMALESALNREQMLRAQLDAVAKERDDLKVCLSRALDAANKLIAEAADEAKRLDDRAVALEAALREIRSVCADRERFVMLGPRGFATALAICDQALAAQDGRVKP